MVLNKDFREFIQSLNAHDVRYLIVGGYAVALHGHPRYTKDLDVWIWRHPQNADKLIAALRDFGFASLNLKANDFLNPEEIVQLGNPPNRIDILADLTGVNFETCYERKLSINIDGTIVHFIDLENLKRNKRAVGRHQDLADVENLE